MKNYSRRELYALGETLGESATRLEAGRRVYGGGGGGVIGNLSNTMLPVAQSATQQQPTQFLNQGSNGFGGFGPPPAAQQPVPFSQATNTPTQFLNQGSNGYGDFGPLPAGISARAVAADPQGYQQWLQQAQAQEAAMPGSTMFGAQQYSIGGSGPGSDFGYGGGGGGVIGIGGSGPGSDFGYGGGGGGVIGIGGSGPGSDFGYGSNTMLPVAGAQQPVPFSQATNTPIGNVPSVLPQSQIETQAGVADYAQPYVNTMLGATMQNLFNYDQSGNATGMKGFTPYSYNPADYFAAFTPMQEQAQSGIASLQDPWQTEAASGAMQNAINRAQNISYSPTDTGYDRVSAANAQAAQLGAAPTAAAAQTDYRPELTTFQMGPAERVGTQSFVQPGTAEKFMSPYIKNVLDVQTQEARRQAAIGDQVAQAQAARSGMFGGSGMSRMRSGSAADLQRNLANIQATGLQNAFQNAQQQFNAEQGYGLQAGMANQQAGLTTGQQNLAAQLGVQQLGTQTGLQTALQNLVNRQQTALANQSMAGQYGLAQGQFQQAANLQNAQQQLQAQQFNQAARQQANQLAAQQRQFGANLGLQGLQAAMSGASQLGALGSTGLQNRLNILNAQNQAGAQQQALQQQIINQGVQNYNTAQQYPYMQLGFMQNMLQGLPITTSSQQSYQAAPSTVSQLAGLGLGLGSLLRSSGGAGGITGGLNNLGGGLLNGIGNTVSGIGSLVTGAGNLIDKAPKALSSVGDFASKAWDTVTGWFAEGGEVSEDPVRKIEDKINKNDIQGLIALAMSKLD